MTFKANVLNKNVTTDSPTTSQDIPTPKQAPEASIQDQSEEPSSQEVDEASEKTKNVEYITDLAKRRKNFRT